MQASQTTVTPAELDAIWTKIVDFHPEVTH